MHMAERQDREPRVGVILDPFKPVPIWHRIADHLEGVTASNFRTDCGRKIGFFSTVLPIMHLKRFARRCRSCSQA
jgi:hypothetical protein